MASPVAFSITWHQLAALRALPQPVPNRSYPYAGTAVLIDKGYARIDAGVILPTDKGIALKRALAGLSHPK